MRFTKMEGCGNDYIYVDVTEQPVHDPEDFAIRFSDRHFGIGADGLITIGRSGTADFSMHIYNADGSEAQMCGNGIRCAARYVHDRGLTDKDELTIETLSGPRTVRLLLENGKAVRVRVDMGAPSLLARDVPVVGLGSIVTEKSVHVAGRDWIMTCVSVGNPHAVVWTDDAASVDLPVIGPLFENHDMFPERVNTEFVQIIDRENIRMRVWERGSGETIACGTGAAASAFACMTAGRCAYRVNVHLDGGDLEIEYDEASGHLFMTGAATFVFDGEVDW